MAKAPKEVTATTMFRPFVSIVKKLKYLGDGFVKLPNNFVYVFRSDSFLESFAILNDPLLNEYYDWLACCPSELISNISQYELKAKNTHVEDFETKMTVFNDGVKCFDVEKVPGNTTESRRLNVEEKFKRIPEYVPKLRNCDKWETVSPESIRDISDGRPVAIEGAGFGTIVTKAMFPLVKDMEKLEVTRLDYFKEFNKAILGFKETYPQFTVYTICAILNV